MEETLEKAARDYHRENQYVGDSLVEEDRDKDSFFAGAEWQAKRMFTEDQMFMFAGYCMGKKLVDPFKDASVIMQEWKEEFKNSQDA